MRISIFLWNWRYRSQFVGLLKTLSERKGELLYSPNGSIVRPAELHSPSAGGYCMTENVASLRSVKVATPPCAVKAAIPCGLAASKFED